MSDDALELSEPVPLFPLPNVVLLPGMTLPLQIFEPRYRLMVKEALEGERLIAMALLLPGYEPYYHTNTAPIHPVVCVGIIRDHVQLPDGRRFINLVGLCPAEILQEFHEGEYRTAMLEAIIRPGDAMDLDGQYAARRAILDVIDGEVFSELDQIGKLRERVSGDEPLDDVVDCLAARLLPSDAVEIRQQLLAETDTLRRVTTLVGEMRTLAKSLAMQRRLRQDWPRLGSVN